LASSDKIYWADEQFDKPHGGDIKVNYGWTITTNGVPDISKGVNILADKGDMVTAANAGQVVFIDVIPDDGYLVVIDHGAGVRSWYGHLDTVYVKRGDTVSKGQDIATVGTSGFFTSLGVNLYFAVSVHNVFVTPVGVIEKGILQN
jgi:murein DD-endopeptidase MepM/ murein hydrolase activator NlpD